MNKKGYDYPSLMIVVVAISLSALLFSLLNKTDNFDEKIGYAQSTILNANSEAEKQLVFIDSAAKLSANKAITELAKKAGFTEKNCGYIKEYYYWNKAQNPEELCEKNIYENYETLVDKELNNYFKKINEEKKENYPENNYDYLTTENEVKGFAAIPLKFALFSERKSVKAKLLGITFKEYETTQPLQGTYAIKPSFSVKVNHGLEQYEQLEEIAKKIITECNNQFLEEQEKIGCVNKNTPQDIKAEQLKDSNDVFLFTTALNAKNEYEKENQELKFALLIKSKKEELLNKVEI